RHLTPSDVNRFFRQPIKLVRFHPTQHRWWCIASLEELRMQFFECPFIIRAVSRAEVLEVADVSWIDDVHYAPEIVQLVLDGGAREPHREIGMHRFCCTGCQRCC